jgi:hypothetical protein
LLGQRVTTSGLLLGGDASVEYGSFAPVAVRARSEHADFASGWQAGTHVVTSDDKGGAYSLYSPSGIRVAKFGHARLTPHSGTDHTLMIDRVLELL